MDFKKIWDIFTDRYSFLPIHPQYYIKSYTNNSVNLALKYAKGTLVDIGCGRMPYRGKFMSKVKKYIGVDNPDTAKYYHGELKPDIYADAVKIPLQSNSCDTVLLLQVLEHLPETEKSLKEAGRLLKKGGHLILSTIQSYPLHDEPYDYYRYTKYGIEHLLTNNNLKVIETKEEGNVFVVCFQSINIYLMLTLKKLIKKRVGTLFIFLVAPVFFILTFLSNIITYPFTFFDKKSSFRIIVTSVAKK
ncbi:MAG: class I SAM-dependent methyltransferase [Patescibacteria group bacterium]